AGDERAAAFGAGDERTVERPSGSGNPGCVAGRPNDVAGMGAMAACLASHRLLFPRFAGRRILRPTGPSRPSRQPRTHETMIIRWVRGRNVRARKASEPRR